jgi:hypothetical protein
LTLIDVAFGVEIWLFLLAWGLVVLARLLAELARGEVPVMIALRLFLPESWTSDAARLKRAGVPVEYRTPRSKPEIALAEIDRAMAASVRFGCWRMQDTASARHFDRVSRHAGWPGPLASLVTSALGVCRVSVFQNIYRDNYDAVRLEPVLRRSSASARH